MPSEKSSLTVREQWALQSIERELNRDDALQRRWDRVQRSRLLRLAALLRRRRRSVLVVLLTLDSALLPTALLVRSSWGYAAFGLLILATAGFATATAAPPRG
ncbi:hypothetical protein [Phaeacidiphilus oryzae]|jgi:hypothetical protein|uniref:hypothetical protein n=1 Tax=Phaeacidiphilus oryzae TaxID=348818 RepID=UPI00056CEBA1|nr:hypothetical protein [Phaeacidiphilus oryzae]